jgi:hypothetical protein
MAPATRSSAAIIRIYALNYTGDGRGKSVIGTYTSIASLQDAAVVFVDKHQPWYDEQFERSVWWDLIVTESTLGEAATRATHYHCFDEHGGMSTRRIFNQY